MAGNTERTLVGAGHPGSCVDWVFRSPEVESIAKAIMAEFMSLPEEALLNWQFRNLPV